MENRGKLGLIPFCFLPVLLTGCGSAEYYQAMQAQLELQAEQYKADRQLKEDQAEKPLVDFTWYALDGTERKMVVNLPPGYGMVPEKPLLMPQIPSPWEIPFRFFDRTLTATERLLPFLATFGREENNGNSSYSLGDNSYLLMTPGDYSAIDFTKDLTTTETTTTETMGD